MEILLLTSKLSIMALKTTTQKTLQQNVTVIDVPPYAKYVSSSKKYKMYFYTQNYITYKENSEGYGEAIVNF